MTVPAPALHASVAAMLAADASLAGPGVEVLSATDGRAVARMVVRPDQVNGHGRVHGGLVFLLADTALACAANSVATPAVTGGADILFVTGATVGEELVAEAAVRSSAGRALVLDATVRVGDRVVAEVRARVVQLRAG